MSFDVRKREINGEVQLWIYDDGQPLWEVSGFGCNRGHVEVCNDCAFCGDDCDGCGYDEEDIGRYE